MSDEKIESVNSLGLYLWLALIAGSLSLYIFRPDLFEPERIRQFFSANMAGGLVVYFIISTLRGFTLIPSTPIVLAGILVFPPWPLWLVNQLCVYTSSAILYYMTRNMHFDNFFYTRYPIQVEKLIVLLRKRELPVISVWGFAPFIPSDMIVCICSVLRINVWKTLLGVSIGEGIICAIYIFGGSAGLALLMNWLQF
ncbi:MAG: VTT domain-containing protein [Gammaproteobacteria bacterium]|nr:VTT domain-containing protein [Gammaproteobacteria bacterium]MDP2142089.1 VTT domain-containing protein [Gammaproteobacteria bacterium]MDP2347250.1 VTT domain-containing protein [Gammaproteobacteria bacterium]